MRVVLQDEVFGSHADRLELLHIFAFGYQNRHQILTEPMYQPEKEGRSDSGLRDWMSSLPVGLREEVEFTLKMGIAALSEAKTKDEIEVVSGKESNWSGSTPQLTVEDARRLLGRSLHLLVENARNDRQFLETMGRRLLGPEYWEPLQEAVNEQWLHYEHGGGIGSMKNAVEELADDPVAGIRTWVMFDSDAPKPGKPSEQSESLLEACEQCEVDHHQLRRRAIENYLPQSALEASAQSVSGRSKTARREAAAAFAEMNQEQRNHFDMKKGFRRAGDESEEPGEVEEPPDFFDDVPLDDRKTLAGGFGKKIGDLFHDSNQPGWEHWLQEEFAPQEKDEFIEIYETIYRKL